MLLEWDVVVFRAAELVMILVKTRLAGVDLVAVQIKLVPVPHYAEQLIVHVALAQAVHEGLVGQIVNYAIVERLYVVWKRFLPDEVQRNNLGFGLVFDLELLNYHAVEI